MDPAQRFAELVNRASTDAHVDYVVALIGAAFDPSTSPAEAVGGALRTLDELAAQCTPTLDSVLEVVFRSGRLRGNRDDYSDPRNSYLHDVVSRGLGLPITLSVCAMAVGRRVGLDIHGIGLPHHFMVACDGVYADPFNGGRSIAAECLEDEWRRVTGSTAAFDAGRCARPVSTRGIALRVLNNLKGVFVAMDEPLPLRTMARLRGAFPELAHERAEYARWARHWN